MNNYLTIRFPNNSNKDTILKSIDEEIMKNLHINDKIRLLSNARIFILKMNDNPMQNECILLVNKNDCYIIFDDEAQNKDFKYEYSYDSYYYSKVPFDIDPRFIKIREEINKKYIELMTEIEYIKFFLKYKKK